MELDILSSVSNYTVQTNGKQHSKTEAGNLSDNAGSAKRASSPNNGRESVYFKTEKGIAHKAAIGKRNDNEIVPGVHQAHTEVEESESKSERIANETLDKAIAEINEKLMGSESECQYSVHKQTGLINIKVYNSKTKEVLREIPPVKRLDALAKMWELAGLLFDTKG